MNIINLLIMVWELKKITFFAIICLYMFVSFITEHLFFFLKYPSMFSCLETIVSHAWLINSVQASKK